MTEVDLYIQVINDSIKYNWALKKTNKERNNLTFQISLTVFAPLEIICTKTNFPWSAYN